MQVEHLEIKGVRNITNCVVKPFPEFNIIWGDNGQGKTSILEAIHILGLGRSFRTRQLSKTIHHQSDHLSVFGHILQTEAKTEVPVGLLCRRSGRFKARILGEPIHSTSELAELLPLRLLNLESYVLFQSGTQHRRRFLDFIVFHVEHNYHMVWQRYQRGLRQRNQLLRHQTSKQELSSWDEELVASGEMIDTKRKEVIKQWLPVAENMIRHFTDGEVEIQYCRGWDQHLSLNDALQSNYAMDLRYKHTQKGPHRADLRFLIDGRPIHDVLSTGQQKVLVCALHISHGLFLKQHCNKPCVYLIDDLPAELDSKHRVLLAKALAMLKGQIFITSVSLNSVKEFLDNNAAVFHVEHGTLSGASK